MANEEGHTRSTASFQESLYKRRPVLPGSDDENKVYVLAHLDCYLCYGVKVALLQRIELPCNPCRV